jgi:hypothetical protein
MTGWATIKKIHQFEERVVKLGFNIVSPVQYQPAQYSNSFKTVWMDDAAGDTIGLTPADDRYPSWTRGGVVFSGSMEQAEFFLQGLEFAHISDTSIGLTTDKKRQTAEDKYIERQRRLEAAKEKKAEQKRMWWILKHGADEEVDEVPF